MANTLKLNFQIMFYLDPRSVTMINLLMQEYFVKTNHYSLRYTVVSNGILLTYSVIAQNSVV